MHLNNNQNIGDYMVSTFTLTMKKVIYTYQPIIFVFFIFILGQCETIVGTVIRGEMEHLELSGFLLASLTLHVEYDGTVHLQPHAYCYSTVAETHSQHK